MSSFGLCQMTERDFAILQRLMSSHRLGSSIIRDGLCEKLASAVVMAPNEIPLQIVTLNSRVRFKRGGQSMETRIVAVSDDVHPVGAVLPVATPLGIAMLGRRSGDQFRVQGLNGEELQAEVIAVVYQPETAERRLRCS